MKPNTNTIILCIGILMILGLIWFTRPVNPNTIRSDEYRKIDSLTHVIEARQLRDSIRNLKVDSLLVVVSNNNDAISGFTNELNKIQNKLDKKITDINNLNANDLIQLDTSQLSQTNSK